MDSRETGIYGSAWMPWLREHPDDVDFMVYQTGQRRPVTTIRDDIAFAGNAGIKVFLDVMLFDIDGNRDANDSARHQSVEYYLDYLQNALDATQGLPLAGVTLDEENTYRNGRATLLGQLYHAAKSRYPQRNFYQWYSSSKKLNVPGRQWPDLPADGWFFDQYTMDPDLYAKYVRQLSKKNLPVIGIVWASPAWQPGDKTRTTLRNWWAESGWRNFYHQLAVNRMYDVPSALFMYWVEDTNENRVIPLWKSDDPCARNFWRYFATQTLPALRMHGALPPIPDKRPDWIPPGCSGS